MIKHLKKILSCENVVYLAIILILLLLIIWNNNSYNGEVIKSNYFDNNDNNTFSLALMYEVTAGSGEYELNENAISGDYVFNEKLSKCENGSKLIYDKKTNIVMMETSSIDQCYAYFDHITLANASK